MVARIVLLIAMLLSGPALAASVGEQLQAASATVVTKSGSGSGAIVIRTPDGGEETAWIVTAAHVVRSGRVVRDTIGDDGTPRKQVNYEDVRITQEKVEDGRTVGETQMMARVITVDHSRDTALLMVRAHGWLHSGVTFYLDESIPPPGTAIYHCGSPGGQSNAAALTAGIISRVGRTISNFVGDENGYYDQLDAATLPGSSGGIIASQADGRYIGMLTLGLQGSDAFGYFTPIRLMREWGKEAKIEWVFDPAVKVPKIEVILKTNIETAPPR